MKINLKIKPGTICCVTNKCLEQFLKSGLWNNKSNLLKFLAGESTELNIKNAYSEFENQIDNHEEKIQKDRLILIIDCHSYTSVVHGVTEEFIITGFLFKDKLYYSYFHSLYEEDLEEFLPKILYNSTEKPTNL